MFDHSNTPGTARTEDQPLVKAIKDARSQYGFSAATAGELFDDFTKPKPALRQWIFDLCDPSPRASPFMTDDEVAAFARDLSGQDCSARRVERLAHRIKRFVQDKRRVWMGAGRPQNVDRALILYVIRRIEEATGIPFGFSRPQPRYHLGGPRLLLAEAALHRLFAGLDRLFPDDWVSRYLGLASPARHYTRDEIARTAKLVRRLRKASKTSPAWWQSDEILAFSGDVRSELMGKARQENKDQRIALPIASFRGMFKAAFASGRQTRLKYGSRLDDLQANLKSGVQPDLIELAKGKMPHDDQ